jgi:hypothetical protein
MASELVNQANIETGGALPETGDSIYLCVGLLSVEEVVKFFVDVEVFLNSLLCFGEEGLDPGRADTDPLIETVAPPVIGTHFI